MSEPYKIYYDLSQLTWKIDKLFIDKDGEGNTISQYYVTFAEVNDLREVSENLVELGKLIVTAYGEYRWKYEKTD